MSLPYFLSPFTHWASKDESTMKIDLDKIEAVAASGRDSFGDEEPSWYNGGWSEGSVSPKTVLALVQRVRELEEAVNEQRVRVIRAELDAEGLRRVLRRGVNRANGEDDGY